MSNMKTRLIDLVCFDLDGVLVDTNALHVDAWLKTLRHFGSRITKEAYINKTVGFPPDKVIEEFFGIVNNLKKDEIKTTKNKIFIELIKEYGCQLYNDSYELLRRLNNDGYKTALVSTSASAHFIINFIGLKNDFDTVITGLDVSHNKPDPEPYLKALSRLNAKTAIAFEDTKTGVQSATRAGIFCIGVLRNTKNIELGADFYLNTGFDIDSGYLEKLVSSWLKNKT